MNNSGIFRSAAICTVFEALVGGGLGGGLHMSLVRVSKPVVSCVEEEAISLRRHFLIVFALLSTL